MLPLKLQQLRQDQVWMNASNEHEEYDFNGDEKCIHQSDEVKE
jgi:hypothetical protein